MARWIILALPLLLLAAPNARAGFAIPQHVYRMDRLESAISEARAKRKALAFVYSKESTNCGLARAATLDAFRELQHRCVIVYVDRASLGRVPTVARKALRSEQAGRYIPSVAVLDWDLKEIICVVPYARRPRRGELLHQANDLILKHARRRPQQQLTELPFLTGMPSPTPQQPKPLPKEQAQARPELIVHWKGKLRPAPRAKLSEFFLANDIPFEILGCKPFECRFRVTADQPAEAFQTNLQIFLNINYQVEKLDADPERTTVWLGSL